MNFLRLTIFTLTSLCITVFHPVLAQSAASPTNSDIAGVWVVTQNSKPTDTLREISLHPNGNALLKHSSMSFKRRWKVSDGILTIFAAKDEFAPGPPDHYKVIAFDAARKQLDLKNEMLRRDIRLVKSQ